MNFSDAVSSRRTLHQLEIADHLWDVVEQASFEMGADPSVLINQALFAWACQHGYLQPGAVSRPTQAIPAVRAVNAPTPVPAPSAPVPPSLKPKTVTSPMPALQRPVAMKAFPKKERVGRGRSSPPPPPPPEPSSPRPPPLPPPVPPVAEVTAPMSSSVAAPGELDWLPQEAPDLPMDEPAADQTALINVKPHRKPDRTVVGRPDRQLYLFVEGLDPVAITSATFVIGRDHSCDLPLQSSRISRQHARITRDENGVTIQDLESSNGTWFNGERISQHGIEHGDEFEIGDFQLRFEYR